MQEKDIRTRPPYSVSKSVYSAYTHRDQAVESIRKMQLFDISPNVLICLSHDPALLEVLPTLNKQPGKDLGDWKAQGWKEDCQWRFLNELPQNGERGADILVDGLWKNGKPFSL